MKKTKLFALLLLSFICELNAQYTTDYPFDSTWVKSFSGPVFNLQDLGAKPDDTINDSRYFRMAVDSIKHYGTGKLVIPAGTYIVGEQIIDTSADSPYYNYQAIFKIDSINQLIIEGSKNTIIKAADGLAFGSFDPVSGEAYYDDGEEGFVDWRYRADAEVMFDLWACKNVLIKNLELDGNIESMKVGGYWGHKSSRQCEAIGILALNNTNVMIKDIYTHHHGLDGLEIGHYGIEEGDQPSRIVVENLVSEYNARQGLSWIGGIGLTVYNSKMNHTSRAGFSSNPASGVDIEAEDAVIRGGKFIDCEFINNEGEGLICDSGDGGYTTFENCTFWGTTNYSIWVGKPGLKFKNCKIYGFVPVMYGDDNPDLATSFDNCLFEDKPHPDYGIDDNEWLMFLWGPGPNISFSNCDFVANTRKSFKVTNPDGDFVFNNCTITHRDTSLEDGGKMCSLETSILNNVQIIDEFPEGFDKKYWIEIYYTTVENCVYVDGQNVFWGNTNGYSDWIEPGIYPKIKTLGINYPNNKETFSKSDTLTIKWDIGSASDSVKITLYDDCNLSLEIANMTENDGIFNWLIPKSVLSGDQYKIKIEDFAEPKDFDFCDSTFTIDNNIGIEDNTETKAKIIVYPNPSDKIVFIQTNDEKKTEIEIFNILGELQYQKKFYKKHSIDVSNWDGIYFIKCKKQIEKLMINK